MMKRLIICAVLLALCATTTAFAAGIDVVCTIFPPYDFARALVAGTESTVSMLIKPGVESHSFDPKPSDIVRIEEADVFAYIGGENDAWVDRVLTATDAPSLLRVRMMDAVHVLDEQPAAGSERSDEREPDQHIWTSPKNAIKMTRALADALCAKDPDNEAIYRANEADYTAKLAALDAAFQAVVDGGARRELVFGDRFAFRYLAEDYGLTCYAAFAGCSSETEPSVATIAALIDRVRDDQIPVVYHLEQGNVRVAETIAGETGARVMTLHACHNISADELDAGCTYLSLMQNNVEALRAGLA